MGTAQQKRQTASRPNDLSSIPRITDRRVNSLKLFDLNIISTYTKQTDIKYKLKKEFKRLLISKGVTGSNRRH